MSSFETATAVERLSDTQFSWDVPEGWLQGRGCWGGLVVGALLRAVTAAESDPERRLRSVAGHIMAPTRVGRHVVDVTCARRGSGVTTWDASLRDEDGRSVAVFTAIVGSARLADAGIPFEAWRMLTVPDVPPADTVPVVEIGPPFAPEFMQHIAFRPISGIPGELGSPQTMSWVDFSAPTTLDPVALFALADASWPASMVSLPGMRPMGTLSFAANLLVAPDSIAGPLLHEGLVSAAQEGFTSEHRRLWSSDGRLVVDNLQSIVVIS